MSRRKQSKPRQIKRSLGDLDGSEENTDNQSVSGEEGGASDPEDSAEGESCSPTPHTPACEEPSCQDSPRAPGEDHRKDPGATPSGAEEEEDAEEDGPALQWDAPDDLQLTEDDAGSSRVVARRDLHTDTTWGPYPGTIRSEVGTGPGPESCRTSLACEDPRCWLGRLSLTSDPAAANLTVYVQGQRLFCKVTREVAAGERLLAAAVLPPASATPAGQNQDQPSYPAALHSDIQLLPQQAGMAAILATAVVNKDIFPCKDCGIWYRSERNLQAHLLYYCASRQKQPAAAASPPPQDRPRESYPNERVCPFPQCHKSCPSASSLEIHMRTHSGERPFVCLVCLSAFTTKANCERHLKVHTDTLSGACHGCGFVSTSRDVLYSHLLSSHMLCQPAPRTEGHSPGAAPLKPPLSAGLALGDSGVVLKCQVCGHNCDSASQLQQHVRTHLDVRVPAERSPTPRRSTPSPQEREPPACVPLPDSSSPGADGSAAAPLGCSPPDVKVKEEPQSDGEAEEATAEATAGDGATDQEPEQKPARPSATCQTSSSPKSPTVKAEPTSPTPGSSPTHIGGAASLFPGGAVFLPQYMFSAEGAILPQASEILAKMSEMVHSRLKQGQAAPDSPAALFQSGAATTATAAAQPPKGATCFECDITFNNINNYYAHKRLYCSSRRHAEASDPGSVEPPPCGAAHASSGSPQEGAAGRAPSVSPTRSDPAAVPEVKAEAAAGRERVSSASEGEGGGGGGRASEGSQSPASGSTEELDDDPNKTFCEACNIRFSRHDNYMVHKRFYCASRHDPSHQRSLHSSKSAPSSPFVPQPIRKRKRKKMYEIHMARTEALANAAAAAAIAAANSAAAAAPSPSVLGLALKQEASPGGTGGSSPEGEGPIDLSKRPRLREAPRPALPLTDYHKCSACSISFNSIENYLAHKTYYCPATTLQKLTLEQIQRLQRASPGPGSSSPSEVSSPPSAPRASPQTVCPYCPDRVVAADFVEHFRSVHGLVLNIKLPQEPCRSPRGHADGVNGQTPSGPPSPASPRANGSPSAGSGSPSGAPAQTTSSVPEVKRESSPAAASHPSSTSPVPTHVQNGNSRFCRLCNIKFSSLSTFIAHKKYYCSSHSAEHVK
ncbi:zinc finger protein ZFPM1 isoform X1 [Synchiropus splendidus]|uniref:zinc finger protein ZFPM1 isoform X1 n=1 Tax=Synchiropus splendidus TaxID=270530 RepID=UPI00237DE8AD|nr:zinc finger protein ZFPM1 isoform X1 [Synchiropus splendidus]